MLLEKISSTTLMLYEQMGNFFPLFILLAVYQLTMTVFCAFKILQNKTEIADEDKKAIKDLGYSNRMFSELTVTLGLIGTFIGVILILKDAESVIPTDIFSGLSVALTTTLAALLIAGIWGLFINGYLVRILKRKYGIPDEHGYLNLIVKHLKSITVLLNEINEFNKSKKNKLNSNAESQKKSSNDSNDELHKTFFS